MSHIPNIDQLLASLLAGNTTFIQVPPGHPDPEAFLNEAMAKAEAEHRKSCPDCAAAYAAEQAVEKAQTAEAQAKPAPDPVDRIIVGYMAFLTENGNTRAMPRSFRSTREEVENSLARYKQILETSKMNVFLDMIGFKQSFEIKPVFAD